MREQLSIVDEHLYGQLRSVSLHVLHRSARGLFEFLEVSGGDAHGVVLAGQIVARPGAERADLKRLAAVIYAIESVETYTLFVTEAGWTLLQWRDWVNTTVERELVPPQ
ncbi:MULTISPECIES: hypothetical protein [Mycolicibacterium]|uniref:Uncharacterized protein n=1 Tax=Mycolicibacterium austroafricanum TaxID=39687 RepID=A0ABT8H903_MYCAO|nr:hypothetical protein [Mycolicibacterium austroafricanum]MDN4517245.1 hypothetical protein [Mycolicibacterium austroafricanum]